MKQIVVILLIFLCELGELSAQDDNVTFINKVNELRKWYANNFRIKNMKKMKWDDALRSKAEDLCALCGKREYNNTFRHYVIFEPSINITYDEMFINGQIKEMIGLSNDTEKAILMKLELIVPTQNKIGCHTCSKCPLWVRSTDKNVTSIITYRRCAVGPNGNISFSDFVFEPNTTTTKLPSTKNGEVFIPRGSEAANTTGSVPSTTVTSTTHSTSPSSNSTAPTSTSHSPSTLTTSWNTATLKGSTRVSTLRPPAKSTNVFTSRSPAKTTNLPPMAMILVEDYPEDTTDPIDDIEDSSPSKVSFIIFLICLFYFL
uniref:Uncharacterized protein n=1 Tax=Caenorhabditis japonica TaxID=281687 RepID=A0A8R1HQ39_CAEJA